MYNVLSFMYMYLQNRLVRDTGNLVLVYTCFVSTGILAAEKAGRCVFLADTLSTSSTVMYVLHLIGAILIIVTFG